MNNYNLFQNIYNTNILFNKKSEYIYKINCLPICNNVYFHLLACLLAERFHIENNRRMLLDIPGRLPGHNQSQSI